MICRLFRAKYLIFLGIIAAAPSPRVFGALVQSRQGSAVTVDNGLLRITMDDNSGKFSAQLAGGKKNIFSAAFEKPAGVTAVTEVSDSLGKGAALVFSGAEAAAVHIALYDGLPFVFIRQDLKNSTAQLKKIGRAHV